MATSGRGPRKLTIALGNGAPIYANAKVLKALGELIGDMTLYHGVRFAQVAEAIYDQGLKDGRREIIEKAEGLKDGVKYLNPGPPKKQANKVSARKAPAKKAPAKKKP